ncbi:MAG TPA: ABC transporter substrate binding protein, partial [Methylomirabilota bacterium]
MKRRRLLVGLCTAAFVPSTARTQTAVTVHRIGVLGPRPTPLIDALMSSLSERGWHVGQNLLVETRYTQGDPQRAEALARELVAQRVHLIVTNVTATAIAAHRATKTIPIVMLTSGFPVEGGL